MDIRDRYPKVDIDEIIRLCDMHDTLQDMQYKDMDGEIIHVPDKGLEKERCKVLLDAYDVLERYEEQINDDWAAIKDDISITIDKEREFLKSAHKLCGLYHQDLRMIELFFGMAIDKKAECLKKFFSKEISGHTLVALTIPLRKLAADETVTPKQYAQAANMMFNSRYFRKDQNNKVYNTFQSFYREFCEIVGCEYIPSYKPSNLNPSEKIKEVFCHFI